MGEAKSGAMGSETDGEKGNTKSYIIGKAMDDAKGNMTDDAKGDTVGDSKSCEGGYSSLPDNPNSRTALLLGDGALKRLKGAHVAIFGLGGVGGACLEALVRSAIGTFTLIDGDVFSKSNLNRQVLATASEVGASKVLVAKKRVLAINPLATVNLVNAFFPNCKELDFTFFDYIVDAVDDIDAKVAIIKKAKEFSVPLISSMGMGGKLDPTALRVADIEETSVCPLARAVRGRLRALGIKGVPCVYSLEKPVKAKEKKIIPSMAFVPNAAGLVMASVVVRGLTKGSDFINLRTR